MADATHPTGADTPPRTPGLEERIATLREISKGFAEIGVNGDARFMSETADELERLAGAAPAERGGRYREALEEIADSPAGEADDSWEMRAIARRALTPEQGERTDAPPAPGETRVTICTFCDRQISGPPVLYSICSEPCNITPEPAAPTSEAARLADRLDEIRAEFCDGYTLGDAECDALRAAARLLRGERAQTEGER